MPHLRRRYMLESIRPEIRQYFIESDLESVPFSRLHRMMVYQRATKSSDTLPFGTRRDVYKASSLVLSVVTQGSETVSFILKHPSIDQAPRRPSCRILGR